MAMVLVVVLVFGSACERGADPDDLEELSAQLESLRQQVAELRALVEADERAAEEARPQRPTLQGPVTIEVTATPADASLEVDGVVMALPLVLERPRSSGGLAIRVARTGFLTVQRQVPLTADLKLHIEMRPGRGRDVRR